MLSEEVEKAWKWYTNVKGYHFFLTEGNAHEALLLAYLMGRQKCHGPGEFYHTDREINHETGLSLRDIKRARARMQRLAFFKTRRSGARGRTHYLIDVEMIDKILKKQIPKREVQNQYFSGSEVQKPYFRPGSEVQNQHVSLRVLNTKNTHTAPQAAARAISPCGAKCKTPKPQRDTAPFARLFAKAWKAKYGEDYPYDERRQQSPLRLICQHLKWDKKKLRAVLRRYFADTDPFMDGHDIPRLQRNLPKFLVDHKRGGDEGGIYREPPSTAPVAVEGTSINASTMTDEERERWMEQMYDDEEAEYAKDRK